MPARSYGLGVSSYVAFHLVVLGVLSWVGGQRFLLPSLGPSIFALATLPDHEMNFPRRIIGGQFIGAVSAFLAARLFLAPIAFHSTLQPFSPIVLHQVAATFIAVIVTTIGMYITGTQHPPAYATTLIISLGFLGTVRDLLVFLVAILVVVANHEVVGKRLPLWDLPYEYET